MSDYYEDDSFESESDSESGEREELEYRDTKDSVQNQGFTSRDIQLAPGLLSSPRLSAALSMRGTGSPSDDLEEQDLSRLRPA